MNTDTLYQAIRTIAHSLTGGYTGTGVTLLAGILLPILIGMILPRRYTILYGAMINGWVGKILGQRRASFISRGMGIWGIFLHTIQTTFVDLSFGIYISSREDFSKEQKAQKIEEYLKLGTGNGLSSKQDTPELSADTQKIDPDMTKD